MPQKFQVPLDCLAATASQTHMQWLPYEKIKPVLRKNVIHQRNNVVITWKSWEILVIGQNYQDSRGVDVSD